MHSVLTDEHGPFEGHSRAKHAYTALCKSCLSLLFRTCLCDVEIGGHNKTAHFTYTLPF